MLYVKEGLVDQKFVFIMRNHMLHVVQKKFVAVEAIVGQASGYILLYIFKYYSHFLSFDHKILIHIK